MFSWVSLLAVGNQDGLTATAGIEQNIWLAISDRYGVSDTYGMSAVSNGYGSHVMSRHASYIYDEYARVGQTIRQ